MAQVALDEYLVPEPTTGDPEAPDEGPQDQATNDSNKSGPGPTLKWFFQAPASDMTPFSRDKLPRVAMVLLVPMIVCVLVAMVIGIVMNVVCFHGDAFTGATVNAQASVDVLSVAAKSAVIAIALSLARFVARYYTHPRVYGVYSFLTFATLVVSFLVLTYDGTLTVVTKPGISELSQQIYAVFGGNFNYANEQFPTTFKDISSTGDFWNWMRGPVKGVVTASYYNRELVTENYPSAPLLSPAFLWDGASGRAQWVVSMCTLRQLRTTPEEVTKLKSLLDYNIGETVPEFSRATEEKTPTSRSNYTNAYFDHSYETLWGQTAGSWDFAGSSGILYPGSGGHYVTDDHDDVSVLAALL